MSNYYDPYSQARQFSLYAGLRAQERKEADQQESERRRRIESGVGLLNMAEAKRSSDMADARLLLMQRDPDSVTGFKYKLKEKEKMKIDITEYLPFGKLTDVKVKWMQMTFEDYERELKEPEQRQQTSQVTQPAPAAEQEPQTPELAETPAAIPGPPPVASVPNPATGLTPVESS